MTQADSEVSEIVAAPRKDVFRACLEPNAVAAWRVPDSMMAHIHHFDAHVGGSYRMSLTYWDSRNSGGKTAGGTDTFQGRFVAIEPYEKIVEAVSFETANPGFEGEMIITTCFRDVPGGTEVAMHFENLPSGVRPEDNDLGTRQSLRKLAALFG